jgi:replicative DNA helicase
MKLSDLLEKGQPNSLESEKAVLSAMITSTDSILQAISILKATDFYNPYNQQVFEIIAKMFQKNITIDMYTLFEVLEKKQLINKDEGLTDLIDLVDSGLGTNIDSSIKIVLANSQRRKLINYSLEIIKDCYFNADIDNLLDDSEKKILSVGQSRFVKGIEHIKETVIDYSNTIKAKKDNPDFVDKKVVKTNLKTLDNNFKASKSDLIVVAGRPGMGKSSLLLEIARSICVNDKKPVVFFTPEMSKDQVVEKLIALNTNIATQRLGNGFLTTQQWDILNNSIEILSSDDVPFFIDDSPYITINEMRSKLRKFIQKYGEVGAVFTDYLQMLKSEVQGTKAEQISQLALGCKNIAKEFNTVHYLGSQLSRSVEARQDKRPMLSDLKESGGIEENANKVILLYRDEYYKSDTNDLGIAELNIAKHREGPTGIMRMFFESTTTKFQDLENI